MNHNITERLAEFSVETAINDIPVNARNHAKKLLLDSVACSLASDFSDETEPYAAFSKSVAGTGSSTVIGFQEQYSLIGATLLNAYQITAATVCDTYVPAHVHISPEVVPPVLAVAERDQISGSDLLAAIAIGAEVAVRLANGINYKVAGPMGWHMPGIVGPFGAAAAVGRMIGLTPLQMRNAFGIAGSQAAGTWASWGTPTVKFHQSRGAGSGLIAATLAETDFTASTDIIAHPDGGILHAYSDGGSPERVLENVGKTWEFEQIALRVWPGGTPIQPTLTAIQSLLEEKVPSFSEVEYVEIRISPDVYDQHERFDNPKGVFEALLSFHFASASMLRDRDFWLTSVESDMVGNEEVRSFIENKVRLISDESLTRESSGIVLKMRNGEEISSHAECAKGTSNNPATFDDLSDKFKKCARGRLGESESTELLNALLNIENLIDLKDFFQLLRMPKSRRYP